MTWLLQGFIKSGAQVISVNLDNCNTHYCHMTGNLSGDWSKALICTLLKGGSLNDPKAYRGIYLI